MISLQEALTRVRRGERVESLSVYGNEITHVYVRALFGIFTSYSCIRILDLNLDHDVGLGLFENFLEVIEKTGIQAIQVHSTRINGVHYFADSFRVRIFARALTKMKVLRQLVFVNCGFTSSGFDILCTHLRRCKLSQLRIRLHDLTDSNVHRLCHLLPGLDTLELRWCHFNDTHVRIISEWLPRSSLNSFNVVYNEMTEIGIGLLCEAVRNVPSIHSLYVSYCQQSNGVIEHLGNLIRTSKLKSIEMERCGLTDENVGQFAQCIRDSMSITYMDCSVTALTSIKPIIQAVRTHRSVYACMIDAPAHEQDELRKVIRIAQSNRAWILTVLLSVHVIPRMNTSMFRLYPKDLLRRLGEMLSHVE